MRTRASLSWYFYPRPPRGGRPPRPRLHLPKQKFLSTPSARRATLWSHLVRNPVEISIHALREEGDAPRSSARAAALHFYPRPPRGGRPSPRVTFPPSQQYISIHALREEGDAQRPRFPRRCAAFLSTPSARRATLRQDSGGNHIAISIHALREEGDVPALALCHAGCGISIHALREEGDGWLVIAADGTAAFLSTPSARRAT